jgi:nicotinate-nucleotide pyrophosphorylase (carboxylating)
MEIRETAAGQPRLDASFVRREVTDFLAEDIGRGDRTTDAVVPVDAMGRARIEVREAAVIAGTDVARACFEVTGGSHSLAWDAIAADGSAVNPGQIVAAVEGSLRGLLTAERTALNLLARLSGIATLTAAFVQAVRGCPTRIVDTRKTTPGLRILEKYAVRIGGGHNHRFGLDDGILIKDNHIAAAGHLTEAVHRAKAATPPGLRVQIEVTDLDELHAAISAGADAVLLDNMSPAQVAAAVAAAGGKVVLEASGGVTLDNVRAYAETGVDMISVGALTHSARSIDVSMEVEA